MITWTTIKNYNLASEEWKWVLREFPGLNWVSAYDGSCWIVRFWKYLTDPMHWDVCCSPGFAAFFKHLKDKFLTMLTPWYRLRHRFIIAFGSLNGSKVLADGHGWIKVRNRQADCAYYNLVCRGFRYTLVKSQLIDKDGVPRNAFLTAITEAFSDSDKEEEKYTMKDELVCKGWVFTRKQVLKELNRIAFLTPDLEWVSLDKDGNWPESEYDKMLEEENGSENEKD